MVHIFVTVIFILVIQGGYIIALTFSLFTETNFSTFFHPLNISFISVRALTRKVTAVMVNDEYKGNQA